MTLIERLSAAAEGSWQLDSEIHVAVGRCLHRETKTVYYEEGESSDSTTRCRACGADTYGAKVPEYSRSIDSALTLVPEGYYVRLERYSDGWYAVVCERSSMISRAKGRSEQRPTAALAVATAAYRAREAA